MPIVPRQFVDRHCDDDPSAQGMRYVVGNAALSPDPDANVMHCVVPNYATGSSANWRYLATAPDLTTTPIAALPLPPGVCASSAPKSAPKPIVSRDGGGAPPPGGPQRLMGVGDVSTHTVQLDDTPATIAQRFTGDPSRMRELIAANPHKPTQSIQGVTTFQSLTAGEKLLIPASWMR